MSQSSGRRINPSTSAQSSLDGSLPGLEHVSDDGSRHSTTQFVIPQKDPIFRHTRPFVSLSGPTSRRRPMKPGPASFWLYLSGVPSNNDLYCEQWPEELSDGNHVPSETYTTPTTISRRERSEQLHRVKSEGNAQAGGSRLC